MAVFRILLLLPFVLAACGSGAAPDPRTAALHLTDLPPGSSISSAGYGHVTGAARAYSVTFARPAYVGIVGLTERVEAYPSEAAAHAGFLRLHDSTAHGHQLGATTGGTQHGQAVVYIPFTPDHLPRTLADPHAAYSAGWAGDEYAYTTHILLLQHRSWVVYLRVAGVQGSLPWSAVLHLANLTLHRLS